MMALVNTAAAQEAKFFWQEKHANVSESGAITPVKRNMAPDPKTLGTLRYIDFDNGNDARDGSSTANAWKHHPWDPAFTGTFAKPGGTVSFVFKNGVKYRGEIAVPNGAGKFNLVKGPSNWGTGEAVISGAEIVGNWKKGTDAHPKIPAANADKIWHTDLDFAPRSVWFTRGAGEPARLALARHPNWVSQPEDHKQQWFSWTNERNPFQAKEGFSGNDSKNLKGLDRDFVVGAIIYSEFGWVMGNPYPTTVENYDPSDGAVKFDYWTGGGNATVIHGGMRYYLEDKPQYLDDVVNGEYWFEKKGNGGRLYVLLPGGAAPGGFVVEAGKRESLVYGGDVEDVKINGLVFEKTTPNWNLGVVYWDFTKFPWGSTRESTPACIRVYGNARNIEVSNCVFRDAVAGVRMKAENGGEINGIRITDNDFKRLDATAATLSNGSGWGFAYPTGVLDNIDVLRNTATDIGYRTTRYERGCVFNLVGIRVGEIAGNLTLRSGAQGIDVVGGKGTGQRTEIPLTRVIIRENAVMKSMQNCNDFGGIEAWQHGPIFIYNNFSFDPRGQWEWHRLLGKSQGFGHAYYLDGGFKNYLFNNIAAGLSNDMTSPLVNCSAFQEIYSFQNMFFNNSAYNFAVGSRRQSPHAGRNKFLGNVWSDMSERVFRHSEPANTAADGNAADAGVQKEVFDMASNAYAQNIFWEVGEIGCVEPSGRWLKGISDFAAPLEKAGALASSVGVMDKVPPFVNAAKHDFRLRQGSAAIDAGVKAFVPWPLALTVGEWNFCEPASIASGGPVRVLDEHWLAADYLAERGDYWQRPTWPLTVENAAKGSFVKGPLEDWTLGALHISPAKNVYARVTDADIKKPYTTKLATQHIHGKDSLTREFTFAGKDLRSPEIYDSNFIIELFAKFNSKDGAVASKWDGKNGWALKLDGGNLVFEMAGDRSAAPEKAKVAADFADGKWRHILIEVVMEGITPEIRVFVNGKSAEVAKAGRWGSLSNGADLLLGAADSSKSADFEIDFLRIALSSLEESRTSAEELFTWQFNGPQSKDMRGTAPKGKGRDAGALESW